jgi:hypothetical protein
MPDSNNTINQRLRELEKIKSADKKGDYVDSIGINRSKYYRMREDGTDVSCRDIEQICERLNLTTEEKVWLFTGIKIDTESLKGSIKAEFEEEKRDLQQTIKKQADFIDQLRHYIPPPPSRTPESSTQEKAGEKRTRVQPKKPHPS